MSGRKRKLNENKQGNRTLEELNEQQQIENKLTEFEPLSDKPPAWLSKKAKLEWARVIKPLSQLPTSELDRNMLAMYCYNYSLYRDLQKLVEKGEQTITKEIVSGNEVIKKNPAFQNLMTIQQELMKLSANLGMTIDSRMRLVTPEVKSRETLADMLFKKGNDG